MVKPTVTSSSVTGTYYGGAGSGTVELSIDLWDWQGWANYSYADQIGDVKLYSPDAEFQTLSVVESDVSNMTTLTVTAKATEAKTGTIPVLIEIPAPGTLWKQGVKTAPSGEVASYAFVNIEVTEMTCEGDLNVNCDDAVPINSGDSLLGAVCMPHDPSDYYVFTVPSGQVMVGTINLDNFLATDNDLILYDGCPGDPIGFAMTPGTAGESLDVGTLESGFYYIAVLPGELAGDGVQDYSVSLNINLPAGTCTTDDNNDSLTATQIDLVGSNTDTVCAGQDLRDWYKITVPMSKTAGGTLYLNNNSNGNIDVNIYETYPGDPIYVGDNTGTMDEYVIVTALSPGTHYIEVQAIGADPEGNRDYSMDVELYTSDFVCSGGDGNDSYLAADVVAFVDSISDSVCFPADPDWFRFTVPDEYIVTGFISLTSGLLYNNDLYLYSDPVGEPIESSANPGNVDEQVNVGTLNPGVYYIYVAAHPVVSGGDQTYTLTISLEEETTGNFDFKIHAHIICKTDGTSPATTEARVQDDVAWANEFYSQWGMSIELVEISYINHTSWLSGTYNELYTCHQLNKDESGPVNVYYCNNFPDNPSAAAWAKMDCRPQFQSHNSTMVAMSDYGVNMAFAHELGHALGILHDMYLFDQGYSTCAQIKNDYCAPGTDFSYCNKTDEDYGNLMYYSIQDWYDPSDYWLSDTGWQTPATPINSQVESFMYFHIQYPNNF
ncbi:MAG: M12 family metallo-peptidase, partial [bacterium]|nr:M12 family metallo-peptidase [bacterium]